MREVPRSHGATKPRSDWAPVVRESLLAPPAAGVHFRRNPAERGDEMAGAFEPTTGWHQPCGISPGRERLLALPALTVAAIFWGAVQFAFSQTQYVLDNGSIDVGTRTVQAEVPGTGGIRRYELSGSIGQPDAGCLLGELVGANQRGAQIVGGFMGAFACESFGDLMFPYCVIDVDDILCVLDDFSDPATCTADGDIIAAGGDCLPDGIIDVDDILAVLDAFSGIYACPHACVP